MADKILEWIRCPVCGNKISKRFQVTVVKRFEIKMRID